MGEEEDSKELSVVMGLLVFGPGVGPVCTDFLKIHQVTHLRVYMLANFT